MPELVTETVLNDLPLVAPAGEPPKADPSAPPTADIRAHAEEFSPKPEKPNGDVKEERRHRARSQQATAEDAPRINDLTKKWRTAEAELTRLRAEMAARPAPVAAAAPSSGSPVAGARPAPLPVEPARGAAGFPDPEPTLAQFADKDDPYLALNRALGAWDRKRERWEEQQTEEKTKASEAEQAQERQAIEQQQKLEADHGTRMVAYRQQHPDFDAKLAELTKSGDLQLPGVLYHAILTDQNSPAILAHLVSNPVILDEVRLLAQALPPSADSVALMQRRLSHYASTAATTGSAAGAISTLAPRPPNPVRTGPMKASDEPPREGSILAHNKTYGPKRNLRQ